MAGPGIAGFLYTFMGYFDAFFGFVLFIGFTGILSLIFIPNSINHSSKDDESSEDGTRDATDIEGRQQAEEDKRVDYFKFFKDRRTIFSLLTCTYCCFLF